MPQPEGWSIFPQGTVWAGLAVELFVTQPLRPLARLPPCHTGPRGTGISEFT